MTLTTLSIEVALCIAPREVRCVALALPAGSTVADALRAASVPADDVDNLGVWGRRAALAQPLRDGDRVELYRALVVDPKEARRLRYRGQRKRSR